MTVRRVGCAVHDRHLFRAMSCLLLCICVNSFRYANPQYDTI